ncbi:MAG: hypothetical protein V1818_00020 [Candidatus Aenigmatarchaeota archaeon]
MKNNSMKMDAAKAMCPECGCDRFARSIGETSCRKCGLIIDELVMM